MNRLLRRFRPDDWIGDDERVYREALDDIPTDLLAEAFGACLRHHRFSEMPTPADIRAYIADDLADRRAYGGCEAPAVPLLIDMRQQRLLNELADWVRENRLGVLNRRDFERTSAEEIEAIWERWKTAITKRGRAA